MAKISTGVYICDTENINLSIQKKFDLNNQTQQDSKKLKNINVYNKFHLKYKFTNFNL